MLASGLHELSLQLGYVIQTQISITQALGDGYVNSQTYEQYIASKSSSSTEQVSANEEAFNDLIATDNGATGE